MLEKYVVSMLFENKKKRYLTPGECCVRTIEPLIPLDMVCALMVIGFKSLFVKGEGRVLTEQSV